MREGGKAPAFCTKFGQALWCLFESLYIEGKVFFKIKGTCPMVWDIFIVTLHHYYKDVRLRGSSCSIFASAVSLRKAKATGMQALPFQDGQSPRLMGTYRFIIAKMSARRRDNFKLSLLGDLQGVSRRGGAITSSRDLLVVWELESRSQFFQMAEFILGRTFSSTSAPQFGQVLWDLSEAFFVKKKGKAILFCKNEISLSYLTIWDKLGLILHRQRS